MFRGDPLTRTLLVAAAAAGLVVASRPRGPVALGLSRLRVEYRPGAYRVRGHATAGLEVRGPDGAFGAHPGGEYVGPWRALPPGEPPGVVTLETRRRGASLRQGLRVDPAAAEVPWPPAVPPRGLRALVVVDRPDRSPGDPGAGGGAGAVLRRARYRVPAAGSPPAAGPVALPPATDGGRANAGFYLSLVVAAGDAGAWRMRLPGGDEVPLRAQPARAPARVSAARLVLPAAWVKRRGAPTRLEPPAADAGRVSGVVFAEIDAAELGDHSDLDAFWVEARARVGALADGPPGPDAGGGLARWLAAAAARLEESAMSRDPREDFRLFLRAARLVRVCRDFAAFAPGAATAALAAYPGPLRYREALRGAGVTAPVRGAGKRSAAAGAPYRDFLGPVEGGYGAWSRALADLADAGDLAGVPAARMGALVDRVLALRTEAFLDPGEPARVLGVALLAWGGAGRALVRAKLLDRLRRGVEALPEYPSKAADLALLRGGS